MRSSLFDLAVNRAKDYILRRGWINDTVVLEQRLHPWYLKTRFAYRIPLNKIVGCLCLYPYTNTQSYLWQGGEDGTWIPQSIKKSEA